MLSKYAVLFIKRPDNNIWVTVFIFNNMYIRLKEYNIIS